MSNPLNLDCWIEGDEIVCANGARIPKHKWYPVTMESPYPESLVKRLRGMLLITYSALERGGHLTQYQHGEVLDALAAADAAIAANTALPSGAGNRTDDAPDRAGGDGEGAGE